ncbi:MAG: ATP-grasp domain-containing protein [Pseudolabrys sp.]
MLIAAASGRALAASARRGGFVPLVADAFGDQDTLAACAGHARVDLMRRPVDGDGLIDALDRLTAGRDCAGIVCGSGFEDGAGLLARVAARWPLLGNAPETVARLKDPLAFAALCRATDIRHPKTAVTPPPDAQDWLFKRMGGAGGWHVRAAQGAKPGRGVYFQRRAAGEPVSALLLGDGRRVMVLGFSAQWAAPLPGRPFRYGGAVRPAPLANGVLRAMTAAIERLNAAVPLTGLASADFLVDGDAFHLLEVNPRPGASFDLFEPEGASLFALYVEACAGRLPARAPRYDGAMAGAIVYAERAIVAAPALDWPAWTADRPVAGSRIGVDAPLCSVFARAATASEARLSVERRCAHVQALLMAGESLAGAS